jgi:hypothetical protein
MMSRHLPPNDATDTADKAAVFAAALAAARLISLSLYTAFAV